MQVRCVLVCCILDALMEANKTAADASGGNANAMAAADTSLEDVEVNQAAQAAADDAVAAVEAGRTDT